MAKLTYKKSGVDIAQADKFVAGIRGMFARGKASASPAFGAVFPLNSLIKQYRSPVLVSSADGVGTKLLLAQRFGAHRNVGVDLVAMNVNDVVCLGAKPLFFSDYIACGKLKPDVLLKVMKGVKEALRYCGCALTGGETAEMPGVYGPDEYDLAGFCVGIVDKAGIIDGRRIRRGDLLIGLKSSGLHSNGFSLARKALGRKEIKKHKKKLLSPTRLYVKPVLSLLTRKDTAAAVSGIAHVTGGSFYSKVPKILPKGLGMAVNKRSWRVPEIFQDIQRQGRLSEREMYSVFNMGIGMVLAVRRKYARKALGVLNRYCPACVIGEVVKADKRMDLK